jgi:hypothetical protein
MQFVKLTKKLVLIATAATLLAGPALAHAAGRRSPASGGAGLTGPTPAAWVQAPARVVPTGTAPVVPTGTAPVVPTGTAPVVPTGAAPVVPTGAAPVVPTGTAPVPPVPAASVPAPAAPVSPGSAAVSPPDPAPAPGPAMPPPPAASNTTTQTITQVQVSTCVSHCDGGDQVQQASQDNTTVQTVGPPTPRDGGASIVVAPPPTVRTTASTPPTSTPPPASRPSGVTQVQVGCLEHCYGSTTLDTSGMTLGQIEQLLNDLHVPAPPMADTAPAGVQNSTQQTATQSENGVGPQSEVTGQTNGTTQVVVTPAGPPAAGGAGAGTPDGGAPAAAVNQTTQGIVQLQVGCIFYCAGTQQTQQAQQSNATMQTVDSSGAGAVNTVSRVVVQVQVGCVAWCYDAVESQGATGSDASVVSVAAAPEATPPPATTPAGTTPVAPASPGPVTDPNASPESTGARPRDSGGAPVRVPVLGVGVRAPGTVLVPVVTAVTVPIEDRSRASHRAAHPVHHRHRVSSHHRVSRAVGTAPPAVAGTGPRAVAGTSVAQPGLELVALFVLAAVGFGVWRARLVP